MKVAVIDLGTNTFNLLIVLIQQDNNYAILYNKKLPVKLGEGGINNKTIIESAYNRGITAISEHKQVINSYKCDSIYAFATSALRTAKNGQQFIDDVYQQFQIRIELISGDREAELIYHGVKQAVNLSLEPVLILDIGGGSNELIIANQQQVFWKQSYKLGIARLLEKFKPSNPITNTEIKQINQYIHSELNTLFETTKKFNIKKLVGASGSFETFTSMIHANDLETETSKHPEANPISIDQFKLLYNRLIKSTLEERKQMKGLEIMRVEMIVLACIFVNHLIEHLDIQKIIQSNFALKEGIIWELINRQS
jgi:exopolyphosphatase/guanosine-5'-triphosphate,3'-diphosphate pyrophosphatase